jgi:hypothetical protein
MGGKRAKGEKAKREKREKSSLGHAFPFPFFAFSPFPPKVYGQVKTRATEKVAWT